MLIRVTVLVAQAVALAVQSHGQVCEIEYQMQNKYRKVRGPVANIESGLPQEPSTAQFGDWGIETESSRRRDGQQFQGWCHNTERRYTYDPTKCNAYCKQDWYEWSSRTNDARFSPANRKLHNADNGAKRKSSGSGANTHGQGHINFVVSYSTDTSRDHIADSGGCDGALTGHRMKMCELDHWRPFEDKVGTLRFPTLTAPTGGTNCDIYGCDGGRVGSFRSKKSGTTIVSNTAAVRMTRARFVDDNGSCRDPLEDLTCD
ncbi:MAG: hypothetical protein F4Y47_07450 [Acidobacteriia bacterium]|nr:hypothetical protein [Terriglobia bacterium]MYG02007.1 hypothetical protein [Terriglobia bacterium]MYK11139.1 hypothetical protein [Terriglobia bacterium]